MIQVKEIEPKYEAEAYQIWKYGMSQGCRLYGPYAMGHITGYA